MEIKSDYLLSNNVSIPSIGFGTWQIPSGKIAYESTMHALKSGYRHIDTAAAYENEKSVGEAIKASGINRQEIFITSKLKAGMKGYEIAKREFAETIKKLDVDYLDLYLIHAPKPWGINTSGIEYNDQNVETWKAFIDLYHEGKIKAIGVSNFRPEHLQPLLDKTGFVPHVNQIFLCPGALQTETVAYAKPISILIEAYSPFATGRLLKLDLLKTMAIKYNKTMAQIALRWSLQHGFLPLPKSVTPERIEQNLDVFNFEIAQADMDLIDTVKLPFSHH
ncbi:MAG: aldo/keto reductase [Candidatus Izemoplasmatales bacterium]